MIIIRQHIQHTTNNNHSNDHHSSCEQHIIYHMHHFFEFFSALVKTSASHLMLLFQARATHDARCLQYRIPQVGKKKRGQISVSHLSLSRGDRFASLACLRLAQQHVSRQLCVCTAAAAPTTRVLRRGRVCLILESPSFVCLLSYV